MSKISVLLSVILSLCSLQAFAISVEDFNTLNELRLKDFAAFRSRVQSLEPATVDYSKKTHNYYSLLKAYEAVTQADYTNALKFALPVTNYTEDQAVGLRAKSLVANVLIISRDYAKAFSYLEEIKSLIHKVADKRARNHGLNVLSLVYNRVDHYELAYSYSNIIYEDPGSTTEKCHSSFNRIEALIGLNNDHIESEIRNSLAVCEEANEALFSWLITSLHMEFLVKSGKFQQAIAIYEGTLDQPQLNDYATVKTRIYHQATLAYFGIADFTAAETLAKKIIQESRDVLLSMPVQSSYYSLYHIYKNKGQPRQALNYFELYNEAQSAYQNDRADRLLAYNLAQGEIEVKNQRIALLDKDNEVLSLQRDLYEQEAKQNRLVVLILAFVLVIATTLAYRGMTGRKRFKKIAEYDQLTGISNRYHFNNQAKIALDYCENNAKPAAVILFDLDYFKNINDMHGHATGDWALQRVVKTCRNFMRNNDIFGRIGGEEFAVVLPGCQLDKAVLLAEICRDAIAAIDSSDSGIKFPLSASFGVSGSDTSGYQLKQLLADADHAMYRAKEAGRDQVAQYRPASPAV
ncbi:GGDEF domain-containing protein [Rheinheimera sp.]|uniref:GGDEF domain-containing protein n=1 Tax=Rheinheimera sp. TaxID=1869214 RepID=UPI004047D94F